MAASTWTNMARLVSVWGKGGVGKSTVASAIGLLYRDMGLRVLLLSTDPTPAVARLLCKEERTGPATCSGVDIIELSEHDVIELWKSRFGEEVYRVISSFLPVDSSVIDYVARAPGIADEFTLYYIYELIKDSSHDVIVWDTTGAGGSLALLRLERELYEHMGEAARLYVRVRSTLEKLRRGDRDPLELIDAWRELARNILDMLSSESHDLLLVSEPTRLSYHVTQQVLKELKSYGIPVRGIIINKVMDRSLCPGCAVVEEASDECRDALRLFDTLTGVRKLLIPFIEDPEARVRRIAELLKGWGLP